MVPVVKHRVLTESSVPVENTKLALAGAAFHSEQILYRRGRANAALFDLGIRGRERLAQALQSANFTNEGGSAPCSGRRSRGPLDAGSKYWLGRQ
jgi:hypothetical protein